MIVEPAQIAAAWPFGVSLATAVAVRGIGAGKRRASLNEALHELRRPLQALALASPAGRADEPATIEASVRMAATALERLEREINGEAVARASTPIPVRALVAAAVERWRARAVGAGGSLDLRWRVGEATLAGDRFDLAQALDNLIVNAIEHGGPEIVVEVEPRGETLRIAVVDSGRAPRPRSRRPGNPLARLGGRRLHGHGLRVVRRTAAAHGGRFRLRRSGRGTEATLALPLAPGGTVG